MSQNYIERAKQTLLIESQAVHDQIAHIDKNFMSAVDLVAACPGRTIVMGLGKSGIIGRKIAATMSSVGIPAIFLHSAECLHGDLGMVMNGDLVIVLSYSGETDEVKKAMPALKRMDVRVIVMSGRPQAAAWRDADLIINTKIEKEACPYNLAPTASTTALLALGDALALSASAKKGFKQESFAKNHPSGSLGKRLTTKVSDIMRSGKENPVISDDSTVNEALLVMTRTRLGATNIVNRAGKLVGFFTDGDLRRKLQKDQQLLQRKLKDVMTKDPLTITDDVLAIEAAKLLKKNSFDNIPVVSQQGKPVGILDERDLLAEGIVE